MSSTYLELAQKFCQETGISTTLPTTVIGQTGMIKKACNWVADAAEAIQTKWSDWGFLLKEHTASTSSGVKDVSAPDDIGTWDEESFYLNYSTASYVKLYPMDYFDWRDSARLGVQTNAKPYTVIIKPDYDLILYPTPDATYSLTADYYYTPDRLSADDSVSAIPTKFDRLIIAQAKIYWATHEDAPEELRSAMDEYKELMNRLEARYLMGMQPKAKGMNDLVVVPE